MSEKVVVLVDDREPEAAIPRLKELGIAAVTSHMKSGDYAFYPHGLSVGIERKTISNLLGSMKTRQIVTQCHRMVAEYDMSWLLREGRFRRHGTGQVEYLEPRHPKADDDGWVMSGWGWDAFNGMMLDLQLMGIKMIDCPMKGQYPMEIARLAINMSKTDHKWIRERERPDVVTIDSQYKDAVWSLCAFGGIGPETAEGLLSSLGTVLRVIVFAADNPDGLAEIKLRSGKRLGKKKAQKLHEEVTKQWK